MSNNSITFKNINNDGVWEKFVLSHPESNFLQSFYHGQTHIKLGKKVFNIGVYEDSKLIGVCLAVRENARRGRYLSIPGGPLIDWKDIPVAKSLIKYIYQLAKEDNCVFVRLRPQILNSEDSRKLFEKMGLKPSPMHVTAEHTLQLDLKKSEEEILGQMRKTTRYEIKKARKLGISVSNVSGSKEINRFYQIQLETAKRQGFIPFSKELFIAEYEEFSKKKYTSLYKAVLDNKILSYALIIQYPTEASYHFGASTEFGRKYPGSYAVLWQAIGDAKNKRIPRFNFWGIVGESQKNHRFYGVSVFKRGFGGEEVQYIPAHDLIIDPIRYTPTYLFETVRRKVRRLE